MSKVLCFGEILLRYSLSDAFPNEPHIGAYIGGAESNVAFALAKWNVPVSYCTALPANFLSDRILGFYQEAGVETDKIIRSEGRIGSYYLSQGSDVKNAGVIYDREYSAFSKLKPLSIDWNEIFEGVTWFHFSAISPALNKEVAELCEEALIAAAERGITVSLDLNYREKLWKYGAEPGEVMPALAKYAHVIMGNIWAAEKMLGIAITDQSLDVSSTEEDLLKQAEATSRAICLTYPKCTVVANTFRFSLEKGIKYFGVLYQDEQLFKSTTLRAETSIDKVGTGDSFMAGLIYGISKKHQPKDIIQFAAHAAYQKLFIKGDATTATVEEINEVINQH